MPNHAYKRTAVVIFKGVHTFPKGICPKVNVIARLDFELVHDDSAVQRFNHYTTRTPECFLTQARSDKPT